jgi:GT2 family glycosyltransferase
MMATAPPSDWRLTRERPPVVVAIAHWNRVHLLRQCLASLREHTQYLHHRVCVFDQGSTDGSVEYLRTQMPLIDVVFSADNVGFVLATNAIIDRYPAWDVVLLNNDTSVTAGWLSALVDTATRAESIGLVGARLVLPNGILQEAGGDVFADGRVRACGRSESAYDPRFQEPRVVEFCSAACLYVKRTVFDRCGGLERCYEAGYYEDVDLAFKARAAGFKVIYEPKCVVFHRERGTYSSEVAGTLMRRHRDIFRSRWAAQLAERPAAPFELASAGAPRLLLITDRVPGSTLSPRMRRIRQLIRNVNGAFHVAYLNATVPGLDRYAALIEELGATPLFFPIKSPPGAIGLDADELIRANFFPVALCGNPDAACFLRDRFSSLMLDATTIVVDIGMETDVAAAAARTSARHFVVVSEAQRLAVLAALPGARCAVLPLRAEATTSRRQPREARTDIVMLSDNLEGSASAAAFNAMMQIIVPALRSLQPGALLRAGGGPMAAELLADAPAGLEILPSITPIGPVLDRARVVVIAQHWCGPDTISNVMEARVRAIPIVTSRAVVVGAGLVDGANACAVETPDAFAEQIIRVYSDGRRWHALAAAADGAERDGGDLAGSLIDWAFSQPAAANQR